ncbi:hypothetical protein AB0E88_27425 [Streptomyces sp. NPDC028635]
MPPTTGAPTACRTATPAATIMTAPSPAATTPAVTTEAAAAGGGFG